MEGTCSGVSKHFTFLCTLHNVPGRSWPLALHTCQSDCSFNSWSALRGLGIEKGETSGFVSDDHPETGQVRCQDLDHKEMFLWLRRMAQVWFFYISYDPVSFFFLLPKFMETQAWNAFPFPPLELICFLIASLSHILLCPQNLFFPGNANCMFISENVNTLNDEP